MSEEAATLEPDEEAAEAETELPLLPMLFTASSWTASMRFSRSGRMTGEALYAVGEIAFRSAGNERRTYPARAVIVPKDPKLRLDLVLSPRESILTVPLEEFSLQRLRDQIKELVSGYGLVMRLGFRAADRPERQALGSIDFAFSSVPREAAPDPRRSA